jgi:hypothetical protein
VRGIEPVSVPAGTCAADPRWGEPLAGPVLIGSQGEPLTEWAIAPYCTCRGVPEDRWGPAGDGSGKYVAGCCGRPSRAVWEDLRAHGEPPAPDLGQEWSEVAFECQLELPAGQCGICMGVPDPGDEPVTWQDLADEAAAEAGSYVDDGQGGQLKVSNSELRAFKRCRRKWWLSYYRRLRLRREGVGPLSLGNMVHKPLEAYYSQPARDPEAFDWRAPLAEYVEARLADPNLPDHLHEGMLQDYELAKIMLGGYFEWLVEEGADSELAEFTAEQEVEAYLGEVDGTAVWLIGKLDVQARRASDGALTFVDHKSCQTLSDLPKTGPLDEQLKTYGLLQRLKAQADGTVGREEFANGGVWNMLRKVKRTARANPPFYGRAGVTHNDEVYRNFYKRVWGEVRDILAVRRSLDAGGDHQDLAYPNPTRDCTWDCPFFMVCAQFDDGSDVEFVLSTEYVEHDPYERYTEVEKG